MRSGQSCLLISLVLIIGLGISGYIYRDLILDEYNSYWNSNSTSSLDVITTGDKQESTTKLYEISNDINEVVENIEKTSTKTSTDFTTGKRTTIEVPTTTPETTTTIEVTSSTTYTQETTTTLSESIKSSSKISHRPDIYDDEDYTYAEGSGF